MGGRNPGMHVVTNRVRRGERVYTSTLLRRSYRQDGKVKKETLANLSHLPPELIQVIREHLKGAASAQDLPTIEVERSLPAGAVTAVLAMADRLDVAQLLHGRQSHRRDLALALICQRLLGPAEPPNLAGLWRSSLADELGLRDPREDDLQRALDWLATGQRRFQRRLAHRHLAKGHPSIYSLPRGSGGVLCDHHGRPIALAAGLGPRTDVKTLIRDLERIRKRLKLRRVIVVASPGALRRSELKALAQAPKVDFIAPLKPDRARRLLARARPRPWRKGAAGPVEIGSSARRLVAHRDAETGSVEVLYTSVPAARLPGRELVRAYQQARRSASACRPVADAHAGEPILDLLARYLAWHLEQAWAELLTGEGSGPGVSGLLAELATQTRNRVRVGAGPEILERLAEPTPLQARARALLEPHPGQ